MRFLLFCAFVPALALAGIQDRTYHSHLNKREVAIKVYTLPGYEQSSVRYPVVYNLHGGNGGLRRIAPSPSQAPARTWHRF